MSMHTPHRDDSTFDVAWRAFAREDAQAQAPADLEGRILEALARGRHPRHPRRKRYALLALPLAAGLLLTTAMWWPWSDVTRQPTPLTAHAVAAEAVLAAYKAPATPRAAPLYSDGPELRIASRRSTPDTVPPALMSLGPAPLRETEPVYLVRVRVPREALQALGLVLLEPDAPDVVDVDVLIGEDGLARDIRQVRAEQESLP